jgi:hypothetical protein
MKCIAQTGIGLTLLLVLAGIPAGGQNQASSGSQDSAAGSSLGDYARHVRKNSGSSTKPKVFDNDSLPRQDKLSIVGNAPAPGETPAEAKPEESSTSQNAENKPAGEAKAATGETTDFAKEQSDKEAAWKQWGDKIAQQKNQIDLLSRELDVLQREYQIRAAAMYADVGNRLRNSGDWDKQDAQYKQQIADKEKAVQDAKQKLEDMQEEARKAGVPASIREP